VHNERFTEKYGATAIGFGLTGRVVLTCIAVLIGLWFIWEATLGGIAAYVYGAAPAGALYLLFFLPAVLRDVWRKNRRGTR
jgi:hypothetical protein